jgi:hypothetical protein
VEPFTQPVTQYAKSGDVHIVHQAFGEGPINLVLVPGFASNVENYWDEPDLARFLNRLGSGGIPRPRIAVKRLLAGTR